MNSIKNMKNHKVSSGVDYIFHTGIFYYFFFLVDFLAKFLLL